MVGSDKENNRQLNQNLRKNAKENMF